MKLSVIYDVRTFPKVYLSDVPGIPRRTIYDLRTHTAPRPFVTRSTTLTLLNDVRRRMPTMYFLWPCARKCFTPSIGRKVAQFVLLLSIHLILADEGGIGRAKG
ncbi:hypothetical protein RRG08_040006 [Elysia crispata]|uniref:Uncharacterized protein n=1 Tax=Elysia crispata TaxID=231223 RepID=A0AAE0Z850_9GAST|nr:hypothetical protein RRG08_040006 [Elysia crispata]